MSNLKVQFVIVIQHTSLSDPANCFSLSSYLSAQYVRSKNTLGSNSPDPVKGKQTQWLGPSRSNSSQSICSFRSTEKRGGM